MTFLGLEGCPPGVPPVVCFLLLFYIGDEKNWLFRVSGLYHPGYMRITSS